MLCRFILLFLVCLVVQGCGNAGSGTPGATGTTALLNAHQGAWSFDLNKTLALWTTQGVPAAQISQARSVSAAYPLHPDITFTNNAALAHGIVEGEYLLFALHQHNQWVCGKAWYHEDRHDPGDMSKCFVRLEIVNADLHFSLRQQDGVLNLNDPDLTNMPITAGSASACTADAAADPPWSPWTTYVFIRGDSAE